MKCINENCNCNVDDSMDSMIVNVDGDVACCGNCRSEYERQRDDFFNNIGDNDYYNKWMGIGDM